MNIGVIYWVAAALHLQYEVYRRVKLITGEWHHFSFSAYRSELHHLQSQCEVFHRKIKESVEKLTLKDGQIEALVKETHQFERKETDVNDEVSIHLQYVHLTPLLTGYLFESVKILWRHCEFFRIFCNNHKLMFTAIFFYALFKISPLKELLFILDFKYYNFTLTLFFRSEH